MSLAVGTRLGPYEIVAPIGAGGMGEVYRAKDTKLDRDVAIKILPDALARDPERLARFEREAKVLASLNHPNIAQIYGVEDRALIMELVDGENLRAPVPLETALTYAKQIADALEAAHERGIVHRDLKPANIKIKTDGTVKVLDFGLAKAAEEPAGDPHSSPTMTISPTRAGMILGTAAYMSPEQARGKVVDKRADIWAFGVVLYEMLAGRPLFAGETVSDTLAGVLKSDPDWTSLPSETPTSVRRLLRRCLERDRKRRLHDIADARIEIEEAFAEPPPSAKKQYRLIWIAAAGVLLGGSGMWLLSRLRSPRADNQVVRFQIQPPERGRFVLAGAFGGGLAVSPDGRTAAFIVNVGGSIGIWLRSLDTTEAHLLPGTEGATVPFWSPDSKLIAFSAFGKLRAFDLAHGTVSNICDIPGTFTGGAWSDDGRIVFGVREYGGGLLQVAASGGNPSQFTKLGRADGEITHSWPQILRGGRFLYSALSIESENETVYAAPLPEPERRVPLLSSVRRLSGAAYVRADDGNDYLFWIRGTTLVGQRFDTDKLRLTGDSFSVADPAVWVSASRNVLVYAPSLPARQFQWFDRAGRQVGTLGEPGDYVFSRISPDGRRVATIRAGPADIWLLETARGVASRLTSRGIHISPLWSPNGRTILFAGGTPINLFRISAEGSGGEERIIESENRQGPLDWSKDGRLVLYNEAAAETGLDLWTLEVTPDGKPQPGAKPHPYIRAPFNQTLGRFSPDTRWVAYQSDESGRSEVYVQSFPQTHEKVRISTAGGRNPEWGPDGRELFYVSLDGKLIAVAMKLGADSAEPSLPRELFALPNGLTGLGPFDVAADGQRFLVQVTVDKIEPLTAIVNWSALFKKGGAAAP